jgi:DeoR/GlpR family transcriptional regulator of sugar metabolism
MECDDMTIRRDLEMLHRIETVRRRTPIASS